MEKTKTVSIIIPTLNAAGYLPSLIHALKNQTHVPEEILIVDSESTDDTVKIAEQEGIRVLPVKRSGYDHGGTRNFAAAHTTGDAIFFFSQDALPVNEYYIEAMLKSLEQEQVVMTSARQIARESAPPIEKLTRQFNYPADSFVRTKEDIARLGIKAYFFSDVCSAYRREFFEEMGGFESPILTNEDMLMASRALAHGYAIGYCAEASVYHSHKYTLAQQYKRNFDVSVFLQTHRDEIESGSSTGEGIRMVLFTEKELLRQGRIASMIRCVFESGAKFLGNRAGKRYASMSQKTILKKTSNPGYWKQNAHSNVEKRNSYGK